jgi:hypothetical protein
MHLQMVIGQYLRPRHWNFSACHEVTYHPGFEAYRFPKSARTKKVGVDSNGCRYRVFAAAN